MDVDLTRTMFLGLTANMDNGRNVGNPGLMVSLLAFTRTVAAQAVITVLFIPFEDLTAPACRHSGK